MRSYQVDLVSAGRFRFQLHPCIDPVKTCSRHNRLNDLEHGDGKNIKRWTAKRKGALVLDIIQGKATAAEGSRQYDLSPSGVVNRPGFRGGSHSGENASHEQKKRE